MAQAVLASREAIAAPRSIGTLTLSTKALAGRVGINRFKTSGATKVAFSRRTDAVEGIMLNTSGGLTGGDRFDADASAGPGSQLVLTTQAAERAYRSISDVARVRTRLSVGKGAVLHWLPQELIVFDGAALDRSLDVDVADEAEVVLVEPIVFGRLAMGETQLSGRFRDRITLRRNGSPVYRDHLSMAGCISSQLDRPAIANGMMALASALHIGPKAEALLPRIRRMLPETGGASLIAPDILAIRLLAADSFRLRQTLVPLLECLTNSVLPKTWRL